MDTVSIDGLCNALESMSSLQTLLMLSVALWSPRQRALHHAVTDMTRLVHLAMSGICSGLKRMTGLRKLEICLTNAATKAVQITLLGPPDGAAWKVIENGLYGCTRRAPSYRSMSLAIVGVVKPV